MIPDPPAIGVFVLAALALLLVPGPAVVYVVARSIQHGRRAGLVSVLGIHVGTLAHITAATLGLSALVLSSAVAFTAVKIAGAAYLIGLGLWTLFSSRAEPEVALGGERNLRRAFAQGIVVNVLNPKTALFFLAFLPQFVDPNAPHPAVQIAFLGVLFALLGLVTDSLWALAAGTAGGMLRRSRRFVRTQRYVTGTVYVGLGVATALVGSAEDYAEAVTRRRRSRRAARASALRRTGSRPPDARRSRMRPAQPRQSPLDLSVESSWRSSCLNSFGKRPDRGTSRRTSSGSRTHGARPARERSRGRRARAPRRPPRAWARRLPVHDLAQRPRVPLGPRPTMTASAPVVARTLCARARTSRRRRRRPERRRARRAPRSARDRPCRCTSAARNGVQRQ